MRIALPGLTRLDDLFDECGVFWLCIRILRQDLWEMIVTFLISQQNNIVRIRRCIQNICEVYGEEKQDSRGRVYYGFPKPEALARTG